MSGPGVTFTNETSSWLHREVSTGLWPKICQHLWGEQSTSGWGVKGGCVSGPHLTEGGAGAGAGGLARPDGAEPTAAPRLFQLVREDTEPAGEGGNADSEKEKVSVHCGRWAGLLGFALPPMFLGKGQQPPSCLRPAQSPCAGSW